MRRHPLLLFPVLFALLVFAAFLGMAYGSAQLSWQQIWGAFQADSTDTARLILFQLRLPGVLGALLAGMGLSVAGLLLQTTTGNDLCSPNVIGVNAGAGLAVMIFLCLFPMAHKLLPMAAFVGAFGATLLVLTLSFSLGGRTSKATVVLAGVAVGTLFNAGISFLSQLYPEVLSSYSAFSVGGFSGLYLEDLEIPAVVILLGIVLAQCLSPKLNLLCLGDEMAFSLGVRVKSLRLVSLILASALCAATVSFAGLLGFVGLIVPHMARRLAGENIPVLVGICALLGAILVILSDLLGRTLFTPAELPAGILMAIIGAPFFLFLLFKKRR